MEEEKGPSSELEGSGEAKGARGVRDGESKGLKYNIVFFLRDK